MRGNQAEHGNLSVIQSGVCLRGEIRSSGTLEVYGRVEGHIEHDGRLLIGEGALCLSDIRCTELAVAGEVQGDVRVRSRLEVLATGQITGRIFCASLVVQAGGGLTGPVHMGEWEEGVAAEPPVPVRAAAEPAAAAAAPQPAAAAAVAAAPEPRPVGGTVIAFHGNVAARSEHRPPSAATG